ncbi:TonB-dependent receptor plug domain-containing protein [Alkalimarinus alittae]|uniref:TonB-dependent receptor n=1 Tax=Alkalimarinus alittae TaxID=2961619 RepID=A0ABY6N221_9ALTE|nr:TonB-dependent receptor [Alkalimarinus alittae]UZE96037.1 TonB-dependent receptor [Alkalimarinus alittae]
MRKIIRVNMRCSLLVLLTASVSWVEATEKESEEQVLTALEEEIRWLQEESYVTTATKTLENIRKSGATVSVITASELKNMGARNLMDALKRLPGIGVSQFNMGISSVEVRGVKTNFSEKVLYLINGHPTNNNLVNGGGQTSYNNFIVDDIERVEVVRGPGSALYGANAFVAVINIITKDASDINGTELTVGAGSDETHKLNVQFGDTFDQLDVSVNLNVLDTDGINGHVESDAIGQSGTTDFWQQRYELGFQLGYGDYSLQGKYLKRQSGSYLGANNVLNDGTEQEYVDYFFELGYRRALSSQLTFISKLYFDHFQFDNLWEIVPKGYTDTSGFTYPDGLFLRSPIKHDKTGVDAQLEFQLNSQHKLLGGVTAEHQSQYNVELWTNFGSGPMKDISSTTNWNGSHNRDIYAAYVQDIWDMGENLRLIAGARYDHYSDFGSSFNPRLSFTWGFIEHYNFIATYGSAFRAPTFGELYNINNPSIIGNPDVEPEEIETFELGINGDITKRTSLRATWFRNDITNLIGPTPTPSGAAVSESGNVGRLRVDGIEFEISSRLRDGSSVALNYTYQHPFNQVTNERAPEVPLHKANASFNYRHSKHLDGFVGLLYRGSLSRDSADMRSDVPDLVTLDLAVTWKNYIEGLELQASVYNLADTTYSDPSPSGSMLSDYPKPGRSLMVELSYKL